MFKPLHLLETPPKTMRIWRYMGLDKFLALLCSEHLHLTRLDHFKDLYEGRFPLSMEQAWDAFLSDSSRLGPLYKKVRRSLEDVGFGFERSDIFVNCWHESEVESAALWDQYGFAGIAIESTIDRLKKCSRDPRPYFIGRVKYVDFETYEHPTSFNISQICCFKRRSFQHEREVRVICSDYLSRLPSDSENLFNNEFLRLSVSFKKLVTTVWISPLSPSWLADHVSTLLKRFRINGIPIKQSKLYTLS